MEGSFSDVLKATLKKLEISQETAAIKMGLSKAGFSQILNGTKNKDSKKDYTKPTYEFLRRFCWIHNIDKQDRELLFRKLNEEYTILPDCISKDSAYGQVILLILKDNLINGEDFYQNDHQNTKNLLLHLHTELEQRINNNSSFYEAQKNFYKSLQESDKKLKRGIIKPPTKAKPYVSIHIPE